MEFIIVVNVHQVRIEADILLVLILLIYSFLK